MEEFPEFTTVKEEADDEEDVVQSFGDDVAIAFFDPDKPTLALPKVFALAGVEDEKFGVVFDDEFGEVALPYSDGYAAGLVAGNDGAKVGDAVDEFGEVGWTVVPVGEADLTVDLSSVGLDDDHFLKVGLGFILEVLPGGGRLSEEPGSGEGGLEGVVAGGGDCVAGVELDFKLPAGFGFAPAGVDLFYYVSIGEGDEAQKG